MKAKSHPFSMRLSARLDARISAIARRTHRSKAAVAQSLMDEAERCRRYPGIAFRGGDNSRRAWVVSTPLDVWQIIRALQDFDNDIDAMARETDLHLEQIRLATAYYAEFPEEIDEAIALDRRTLDELMREYPFIQHIVVAE